MKSRIALVLAILLGLVAAFGVRSYLKKQKVHTEATLKLTQILAFSRRLPKGTTILPHMLKAKEVPRAAVTSASVLARSNRLVFNKRLVRDVEANQPVQWDDFEVVEMSLRATLRPGERAVTLAVNTITGVAGNVRPGSRVDIYGTFNIVQQAAGGGRRGGAAKAFSKTVLLLADVGVLATDNRTTLTQHSMANRRGTTSSYSSVTVWVTPDETIMLIYAQSSGTLTLALRYGGDTKSQEKVTQMTQTDLLKTAEQLNASRQRRLAPKRAAVDE